MIVSYFGASIPTDPFTSHHCHDTIFRIWHTFKSKLARQKEATSYNAVTKQCHKVTALLPSCLIYLAKSLIKLDTNCRQCKKNIDFDLQYADNISEIATNKQELKSTKEKLPKVLKDRDLKVKHL